MSVECLDEKSFQEKVKKAKNSVLVDFFATWCGPCQSMNQIIDELAKERANSVYKVDVDESNKLAAEYQVVSVPTMIIFKEGKEISRLQGLQNKNSLLEALKKA